MAETSGNARWFVADGSEVRVGDRVRTDYGPDVHGEVVGVESNLGMPLVRLCGGRLAGEVVSLWPGQILGKVRRRSDPRS